MSLTRERTSSGRTHRTRTTRRARRNRKRAAPIWRRLPRRGELGDAARGAWRWIRQGLPAIVAVVGVSAVAAGACVGYRVATSSERFAVRSVELRGNRILPAERLREVVGLEHLAAPDRARLGPNIFQLDLAEMEAALEAEPWIAAATVRRRLPGTLVVEVEENRPAALVEMDGVYLVDGQGVVFARAVIERGDGDGLPVITGIAREDYAAEPAAAQARIRRALEAARLYAEGAAHRPALGEVHVDAYRGITFFTHDTATAVRVGHGSPEALRARLRAFDLAWQALAPEERAQVRVVYADARKQSDRVTVGFAAVAANIR